MKTRQDKEVNNCIGVVCVKTEIELTRPIWSCVVYDKKKRQWCERLYRCGLHRNRNWIIGAYWIGCGMLPKLDTTTTWPIVKCVFHKKNETKLLWSIKLGVICDENQKEQRCDWSYKCCLCQKQNWAIVKDQIGFYLWQKPNMIMIWLII